MPEPEYLKVQTSSEIIDEFNRDIQVDDEDEDDDEENNPN